MPPANGTGVSEASKKWSGSAATAESTPPRVRYAGSGGRNRGNARRYRLHGVAGDVSQRTLLSPAYLASVHCRMEVFIARSHNNSIRPVMAKECFDALRDHEEAGRFFHQ